MIPIGRSTGEVFEPLSSAAATGGELTTFAVQTKDLHLWAPGVVEACPGKCDGGHTEKCWTLSVPRASQNPRALCASISVPEIADGHVAYVRSRSLFDLLIAPDSRAVSMGIV